MTALLFLVLAALSPPVPAMHATPAPDREEGGWHWRLQTHGGALHVWVPAGYDARTAGVVVHLHGFNTQVDDAWARQHLARQFRQGGRNAMYVVPQAARGGWEHIGWPSMAALLGSVQGARIPVPRGDVVLVGHSGAFRTMSGWLAGRRIRQVILLDGLYDDEEAFLDYLARGGRLVLVSKGTLANAKRFLPLAWGGAVVRKSVPATASAFGAEERGARLLHIESQYAHADIMDGGRVLPVLLGIAPLPALVR